MTKQELLNFICEICEITECNDIILRQINKYVTGHGFSYKDIARALCYYVDVMGKKIQLQYGIGIVPFVMKEAQQYFEQERKKQEEQRRAAQTTENITVMRVGPLPAKKSIRKRHIDISQL